MLLKNEDIARLKHKSKYDDNKDDWVIPPFILKDKEMTLPKLKKNAMEVMKQEKENRDVTFEDESNEGSPKKNLTSNLFKNHHRDYDYSDQPPSREMARSQ